MQLFGCPLEFKNHKLTNLTIWSMTILKNESVTKTKESSIRKVRLMHVNSKHIFIVRTLEIEKPLFFYSKSKK